MPLDIEEWLDVENVGADILNAEDNDGDANRIREEIMFSIL